MNKPLSLKIQEFQKDISNIISQAELPLYILKYQIKDLYNEIDKLINDLSQKEIDEYYQSLQENKEETPSD